MTHPGRDMRDSLDQAIGGAIRQNETSVVTKWVCLAETIDESGQRGLWMNASEGASAWDIKGMLLHALDEELALTVRDVPQAT